MQRQLPSDPAVQEIISTLQELGWISVSDNVTARPLTGGVSSDIWRIDLTSGSVCVKRALSKLKVKDDWFAPISRNAYEAKWMQTVRAVNPNAAPEVLFHDAGRGLFVMPYLDPESFPVWKTLLRDGDTRIEDAAGVGKCLGQIHASTAGDPVIAAAFETDEIFHAIRLEPYLLVTGARHPDLNHRMIELSEITASHAVALVHGDVSPKNILIGENGPVFLDAECAWYGDPAFDLAFCLNHLLLKGLWNRSARDGYRACFNAITESYTRKVSTMKDKQIIERAAHLLPGLFLARIDGKSPVEYITDEVQKNIVRQFAPQFLTSPVSHPADICNAWYDHLRMND